jgi:hypothetical protein
MASVAEPTEARARFERVILPRVEKAVHAIALLGNGASRDYETTPEEIRALLDELQDALDAVEARYADRLGVARSTIGATMHEAGADRETPPAARPPREPPCADADFAEAVAAVRAMRWGHAPLLAGAVPPALVAPVITHLIARLADMAEGNRDG